MFSTFNFSLKELLAMSVIYGGWAADLILPHQVDGFTVWAPPRHIKFHKYFVACAKSKVLNGVHLGWREWRVEQSRVMLLEVSCQSGCRQDKTPKAKSLNDNNRRQVIGGSGTSVQRCTLPRDTVRITWSAAILSPSSHSTVTPLPLLSVLFQCTERTGRL